MKNIAFLVLLLATSSAVSAQLTKEQRIEDSIIGWYNKLTNEPSKEIVTKSGVVTAKQRDALVFITNCMMKSYYPVAGLGEFKFRLNASPTSVNEAFKPHSYWIDFRVWNVGYDELDKKGNFLPISEEYTRFPVVINDIPNSYPIYFLNSPSQYYFTWPPDGYYSSEKYPGGKGEPDTRIHPNVYKFITRINEAQNVILAPDNKLPFKEVTIGEFLDESDKAFNRELAKEVTRRTAPWPGNNERDKKSREEVADYVKKEYEKFHAYVFKLKEKYKDNLDKPAVLRHMQPTYNTTFYGDTDPFEITSIERSRKQYYPVFKIDAATKEKCKSDKPQWIAFTFPYLTKENGNQLYEMYTAVTQNLNYEYIANYFFNPEKVKGIPYKPANEEQLMARLNGYRSRLAASYSVAKANYPPNVHFMDDFSSNAEGSEAKNWFFRKFGKHAVVTTLKGESGKWLKLGYGTPVSSTILNNPLPENFFLEFDLATDPNFTPRYGGSVTVTLVTGKTQSDGREGGYGNGAKLTLKLVAGNENELGTPNYGGTLNAEINADPSSNKQNNSEGIRYEYSLKEFSNKRTRIHVGVKVNKNIVTIFVNDKQVGTSKDFKMTYGGKCVVCGFPESTRFNGLFWNNTTNDADNIRVYLGNVKITKE
jgi:hypothetical protein